MESNLIRKLPACIGNLSPSMQLLWAGENRLDEVPATLGRLTNLRSLRLETNWLRTIPVELGQCTLLEDLNLFNNPSLYQPPSEVVVRGCLAIVSYLQRLLEAKCLRARDESDLEDGEAAANKTADDSTGGPDREEDDEEDLDEEDLEEEDLDEEDYYRRRRRRSEEEDVRPPATDVLGDTYLPAQALAEPKHAVRYLNQDCHLLKVYCEGDKVFVDLRVRESERILLRIPEHMIS